MKLIRDEKPSKKSVGSLQFEGISEVCDEFLQMFFSLGFI